MAEMFRMITPITYWILIVLWSFILYFYIKKMWDSKTRQLFQILVIILAIDAFRTLFESVYFGLWYTSLSGLIHWQIGDFLTRPELVIIPKIINVVAAVAIIVLLLKRWLPREEQEQNRLGMALRDREEEFRAFFENNPVSFWLEDLSEVQKRFKVLREEGISDIGAYLNEYPEELRKLAQVIKVKDVNQATLDFHKAENKEQLFQGLEKTFTPESFEAFKKEIIDIWDGKTQSSCDGVVKTLDDEFRYVQISYRILPGYENTLEKVLISIVDNTQKWLAERSTKESEEMFRALFEQTGGYSMVLQPTVNGIPTILDVNEAACKAHGYSRDEMIGKPIADLDDEEGKKLCIIRTQHILSGRPLITENVHVRKDGATFPVAVFANVVRFNNKPPLILTTEFDISDRIKAETERQLLEKQLQQAQKMEAIGTLAGGIAHDFNNILSVILGYTEMAREKTQPGSTVVEDLGVVLDAGNRAKSLVQQILTFSRQDNTERIFIQPSHIVKEVIKMLRPSLPTTIQITQDIDAATGLIWADPNQLNQIIMNLCTNAFHAMEGIGGKLDISLKQQDITSEDIANEPDIEAGAFVQLSVIDTGPGIAPEILGKIFDPYFTTKETGKGTGMGLSIVHGIIKSYGGFVTVNSELGEGTDFNVFLPVVEKTNLPQQEIVEQIQTGKERILFVDDEEALSNMGKSMLERLGYKVTAHSNSFKALETFRNKPDQFDLVITDQTMPGITGGDMARRMLQIRPDIPIILCTGYSTLLSKEKVKSMGIKEFALKPLSKKDIAMLIRKVLDNNKT